MPTIEQLVQLQTRLGIKTHLAYIGSERFVLAHTDIERASGESLAECPVHQELVRWGEEVYWGMGPGFYMETENSWERITIDG